MTSEPELQPGKDYVGVGVGVLIVNDKEETLLMKRGPKSRNLVGYWNKPGGTLEFGEKSEETAKREIKEELGVDIEILGKLETTEAFLEKDQQHWISIQYVAKIVGGTPRICEPDKTTEIAWFPLAKLPEPHSPTLGYSIQSYLDRFKTP